MILDMSGSMQGEGENILRETVIFTLDNLMRPDDRLAIITFSASASLHSDWMGPNGSPSGFNASGGTNFGAAIKQTLSFLGSRGNDPSRAGIALFLSDGHGQAANDDKVRTITEFGFTMHTMGVTSGAEPLHLQNMAELAKGNYFDAPSFDDVKQRFGSLFNYGKTVVYSAPDLGITISEGVTLSNLRQTNGAEIEKGPLGPGRHSVTLSHMRKNVRSELSFKVEVANIECSDNLLAKFDCIGGSTELRVLGTTDEAKVLDAPVNTGITMITKVATVGDVLKTGDKEAATRIITQIESMKKTNPNAGDTAKTLTEAASKTSIGETLETLGKLETDDSGKTKIRDD